MFEEISVDNDKFETCILCQQLTNICFSEAFPLRGTFSTKTTLNACSDPHSVCRVPSLAQTRIVSHVYLFVREETSLIGALSGGPGG